MSYKTLLLTCLLAPVAATVANAGTLVNNHQITLTAEDFTGGTASTQWAIYSPNATENTELWAYTGVNQQGSPIIASSNSVAPVATATWKVEIPDGMAITGFTWAVARLVLNGNGDDLFQWRYSVDSGTTWTTFFSVENASLTTYNNQLFNIIVPSITPSSTILISANNVEGPQEGDSGYFQIWSNPSAGGLNPNSYISIQATQIPESSTVALLGALGCAAAVMLRRLKRR